MGSCDELFAGGIGSPVAFVDIISPQTGYGDEFSAHGRGDGHEDKSRISVASFEIFTEG
jgi:hypothetical protein